MPAREHSSMSGTLRAQNFALLYLCLWTIVPAMAYGSVYRYLAVAAALCWAILEVARKDNIFKRPTAPVLLCLAYILYTLAIEWSLGSAADFDWHIQPAIMFFFLLVYESRRHRLDTLTPVFWWTLATLPLVLIISLAALSEYGHAARIVVRASDEAEELAREGVGGYALVYFCVVMLPILVAITAYRARGIATTAPRVLGRLQTPVPALTAVTAALVALFIFRAQYSIAMYLSLLLLPAVFIPRKYALLVAILILPLGLISLQEDALVKTLEAAGTVVEGTTAGNKINDLLTSLREDQAFGTVGDRVSRYSRSIELFMEAPVLGVLDIRDIGAHSAYLDRFGRYGIFIGSLFVYLVVYVPIRMMKRVGDGFGMAFAVAGISLLFPALNTVFMGFGTALYIMFPVACSFYTSEARARAEPRGHRSPTLGPQLPTVPRR